MKTQPSLGITDPYELDPDAVQRGDRAAAEAEAADQEVLGARLGRDRPVQERRRRDRRLLAATRRTRSRRPTRRSRTSFPKEGATGWLDTWMVSSHTKNLACAYKWLAYISTPKVQAEQAIYFGETPVNSKACPS